MFRDDFHLAVKNIKERKFRAFLTLLGIAIGIMAITALLGIGEGMQQSVTEELSSLSDTILVATGHEVYEKGAFPPAVVFSKFKVELH